MSTEEKPTEVEGPSVLLSHIELKNFKSVASQVVPLRPLSVFVGPNSAGKTTVLQSILMRVRPPENVGPGLVSLNDEVTNLHSMELVRRESTPDGEMVVVGVELKLRIDASATPFLSRLGLEELHLLRRTTNRGKEPEGLEALNEALIASTLLLTTPIADEDDMEPGTAVAHSGHMIVAFGPAGWAEQDYLLARTAAKGKGKDSIPFLPAAAISARFDHHAEAPFTGERGSRGYRLQPLLFRSETPVLEDEVSHPALDLPYGPMGRSCRVAYAEPRRGYPGSFWCFASTKELVVKHLLYAWSQKVGEESEELASTQSDLQDDETWKENWASLEREAVPQARSWVDNYFDYLAARSASDDGTLLVDRLPWMWFMDKNSYPTYDAIELADYQSSLLDWATSSEGDEPEEVRSPTIGPDLNTNLLKLFSDCYEQDPGRLTDLILGQIAEPPFAEGVWFEDRASRTFRIIGTFIENYFNEHVFHVGPLRAKPDTSYRYRPGERKKHVGADGTNTINRLVHSSTTKVVCPSLHGEHETVPLKEAVSRWMGEGEDGHGLRQFSAYESDSFLDVIDIFQVHQKGLETPRHLSELGIGVSQVLPVVVQCLLASPGELVLLQQPELHLHPALQQRLGDFLLACARSGRQIILETHSEYLISRLALRVAEDQTGQIGDDLFNVLLTEKGDNGTEYKPAEIDRYGSITWPTDFFDEGASEAYGILRAGLEKQKGHLLDAAQSYVEAAQATDEASEGSA
jgi:predicted ATPase